MQRAWGHARKNSGSNVQKQIIKKWRMRFTVCAELKQNILAENAEREGKRERIEEMMKFIHDQSVELQEYDEQLVRRLIEKITVFDEKLTVEFRSGVELDVKM